jgi:hypothetical protein
MAHCTHQASLLERFCELSCSLNVSGQWLLDQGMDIGGHEG